MSKSKPTLIKKIKFSDNRGSMDVLYEAEDFQVSIIKMTSSSRGVLRGFHYQMPPTLQAKKIYVLEGIIQDVLIRVDENGCLTNDKIDNILDSSADFIGVNIPENWAHAYLTLSETSKVLYCCNQEYKNEVSFNPLRAYSEWMIGIDQLIISSKDLYEK